jgi:fructose-1,6-bisphosphatase/inositol monophosphatase family enzyme
MSFSVSQLGVVAELLRDAARREIIPRYRNLTDGAVRAKTGPLDLVTEADEAAERIITDGLRQAFPGCVVVGEEAAADDPSLLRGLVGADLAFVVDPVDGTANFAAGLPLFGVMAAVIIRGEVAASVIHDPLGDDSALAVRGEGAWIEAPDGRRRDLRVAPAVPAHLLAGNVAWRFLPEPDKSTVCANLPKLGGVWDYRCSAHEYRMVAAGHCHFLFFNRLYPWDHAPGWLLHREAGGYGMKLDGSPYDPTRVDGGLICAPDRDSWQAVRDTLLGAATGA